jgi:hypothetical protein
VPAFATADTGETVHGIPAVQETGNDPFGNRPQSPMFVLEPFFVLRQEGVPVVQQQTIEGAASESPRCVSHGSGVGAGFQGARGRGDEDNAGEVKDQPESRSRRRQPGGL